MRGKKVLLVACALAVSFFGVDSALAEIRRAIPEQGINYLLTGKHWYLTTYHGGQCAQGTQCELRCGWLSSLVPDCFDQTRMQEDIDNMDLMGVRHVRLSGVSPYLMMEWDKQSGYTGYNHSYYGTAMLDNFRTVLDLLDRKGMKVTVVLMGSPPGIGLPDPPQNHLFRRFFECFESVEGPDGIRVPVYPPRHDSLKTAFADFVAMFKDDPRIVGWELYGEIDSVYFTYGNRGGWMVSWDFINGYFYQMRQNIEALWPLGGRNQNITASWCCYNKEDPHQFDWLSAVDNLTDFYLFSYYDSSGELVDHNDLGVNKEVGFAECGSRSSHVGYPPIELYGMNRIHNVTALTNLWNNMAGQGYLPRVFNPWALDDGNILWRHHQEVNWLMDAWVLRRLYRPPTVVEGPFMGGQIVFAGTDNYSTITDQPERIGIPGLLKITGIEIGKCWDRNISPAGAWNVKCCCPDIYNCDCEMCGQFPVAPCFAASLPPSTSRLTFASDTLTCSLDQGDTPVTAINHLLPPTVLAEKRVMFDVNLTSYEDMGSVMETSAFVTNRSDHPVVVDQCVINDQEVGLVGYEGPVEFNIAEGAGATIDVNLQYVFAGGEEANEGIAKYKVAVSSPDGEEEFYVDVTDVRTHTTGEGISYRVGQISFSYNVGATPALVRITAVEAGDPVVSDDTHAPVEPDTEADDGQGGDNAETGTVGCTYAGRSSTAGGCWWLFALLAMLGWGLFSRRGNGFRNAKKYPGLTSVRVTRRLIKGCVRSERSGTGQSSFPRIRR